MLSVFISLPVSGKTEKEVFEARKQAEAEIAYLLKTSDLEFINSWITDEPPKHLENDKIGLWYLSKSLEKLVDADVIYCAKGWTSFRGCVIEHDAAKFYGIKVYVYSNYLTAKGYYAE